MGETLGAPGAQDFTIQPDRTVDVREDDDVMLTTLADSICRYNNYKDRTGSVKYALSLVHDVFRENVFSQFYRANPIHGNALDDKTVTNPVQAYADTMGHHPDTRVDFIARGWFKIPYWRRELLEKLGSNLIFRPIHDIPATALLADYFSRHEVIQTNDMTELFRRARYNMCPQNQSNAVKLTDLEIVITWNDEGQLSAPLYGFTPPFLAIDLVVPSSEEDTSHSRGLERKKILSRMVLHNSYYPHLPDEDVALSAKEYSNGTVTSAFQLLPVLARIARDRGHHPFAAVDINGREEIIAAPDGNGDWGSNEKHAEMLVMAKAKERGYQRGIQGDTVLTMTTPCNPCAMSLWEAGAYQVGAILQHTKPWNGFLQYGDTRLKKLRKDLGSPPKTFYTDDLDVRRAALDQFIAADAQAVTQKHEEKFQGLIKQNTQLIARDARKMQTRRGRK